MSVAYPHIRETTYAAIDQQALLSRRKPHRSRHKAAALDILLVLRIGELRPVQYLSQPALRRDHDLPAVVRTRGVAGAEDLEKAAGRDPLEEPVDDQLCKERRHLRVNDGLGASRDGVVYERDA